MAKAPAMKDVTFSLLPPPPPPNSVGAVADDDDEMEVEEVVVVAVAELFGQLPKETGATVAAEEEEVLSPPALPKVKGVLVALGSLKPLALAVRSLPLMSPNLKRPLVFGGPAGVAKVVVAAFSPKPPAATGFTSFNLEVSLRPKENGVALVAEVCSGCSVAS